MLRKGTFIPMKTKIQDMTSGSPGRLIILFAIPLMLGNICQQLYTMVDTMSLDRLQVWRLLPHWALLTF